MLLPAAHAFVLRDLPESRAFLYSAVLLLMLTAMIGIATANRRPRNAARSQLAAMVGAYLVLPVAFALPFQQALPDTTFLNAWFEMVSSFTTTGATLYDDPARLAPSLHLWRALVGWLGGFFVLLSAVGDPCTAEPRRVRGHHRRRRRPGRAAARRRSPASPIRHSDCTATRLRSSRSMAA